MLLELRPRSVLELIQHGRTYWRGMDKKGLISLFVWLIWDPKHAFLIRLKSIKGRGPMSDLGTYSLSLDQSSLDLLKLKSFSK